MSPLPRKLSRFDLARLDDVLAGGRTNRRLLPTKSIVLTPVLAPSLISKTRSTRLLGCSMILRFDADVEAAAAAIDFGDALRCRTCTIGRDSVPRGFDCTSADELFVLDLLVAFEGDAIDDRVFDDGDDRCGRRPG